MRKISLAMFIVFMAAALASPTLAAGPNPGISADEAMRVLKTGNARYVEGKPQHPHQDRVRRALTAAQQEGAEEVAEAQADAAQDRMDTDQPINESPAEKEYEIMIAQAEAEGRRPYLVPYGGSSPLGASAYALALEECLAQVTPDWIVLASSSGGTQAGLAAGVQTEPGAGGVCVQSEPGHFRGRRYLRAGVAGATAVVAVGLAGRAGHAGRPPAGNPDPAVGTAAAAGKPSGLCPGNDPQTDPAPNPG